MTNTLGLWLRERRAKLDPAAFGLGGRRRTPGLRREEVAARAHLSPTWYTRLEQGRGGAPSADALNRIAKALILTEAEREHLYLIALGRPPEPNPTAQAELSPRLQRVLDALDPVSAILRNSFWDVLGWNTAATRFLTDYTALAPDQRNVLRNLFLNPASRAAQRDWLSVARYAVGTFRLETRRAGAEVENFVANLSAQSPEFAALWADGEVSAPSDTIIKPMNHPVHGPLDFELTTLAVDGRQDLKILVFHPV